MPPANKTAALSDSLDETYFWRNDHTVLFARRTLGQSVFRVICVDAGTGEKTLPQAFNTKNSPLMKSGRMVVSMEGLPKREMHYLSPNATLSPDGKWLLWSHVDFPRSQWVAAAFDGQQQQWAQGNDTDSSESNRQESVQITGCIPLNDERLEHRLRGLANLRGNAFGAQIALL
jgi:hypothetical protein